MSDNEKNIPENILKVLAELSYSTKRTLSEINMEGLAKAQNIISQLADTQLPNSKINECIDTVYSYSNVQTELSAIFRYEKKRLINHVNHAIVTKNQVMYKPTAEAQLELRKLMDADD